MTRWTVHVAGPVIFGRGNTPWIKLPGAHRDATVDEMVSLIAGLASRHGAAKASCDEFEVISMKRFNALVRR